MIHIEAIGCRFVNPGGVDMVREHGSGDYLFIYFRCDAEVKLNGEYQKVPANTFLLFNVDSPQIYRKLDGHFVNDWVHFTITPYDNFFEKLEIPFETPITLVDPKVITDMMADLFTEFFSTGEQHDYIMDKTASVMFHKFSDVYKITINGSATVNKYGKAFNEIRRKIYQFEYIPEGAEDIAKKLNISVSYVQHIYKQFFGVSINQDIIKGRIEHAARLLHSTDYSVSEVARICGYENLEHFSRQFKKLKGCSPKKFRT